jgi:uncharacterized ferritin-like protein (DUF455 family)
MSQDPTATEIVFKHPSLLEYGATILQTSDSSLKCSLTFEAYDLFLNHNLPLGDLTNPPAVLDAPARPTNLIVVGANEVPTKIRGDTMENNRLRMIHSQAHIESYAIDLSWDILVRFAGFRCIDGTYLPREFFLDWARVADDEARHFAIWEQRLVEFGSYYGAFPTHDLLWESAERTAHDILARLAVVHLVHEAHGLDCGDRLLNQFLGMRDKTSADFFRVITADEVTHVAAGFKWYNHITDKIVHAESQQEEQKDGQERFNPVAHFHHLVQENFHGAPRPPFNHVLRLQAGMTPEWYEPLAKVKSQGEKLNIKELMAQRKLKKQQEGEQNSTQADESSENVAGDVTTAVS